MRDWAGLIDRGARFCADAPRFWLWVTVILAAAHSLLFLLSPMPPLHDYAGHLARIQVMLSGRESPFLQNYYEYTWQLRHNTGGDLIVFALAHVMPIELAGRILVAAIPALTFLGLGWVRLKAHGRIDGLILLGAPYVIGTWFGWGFLNFSLSTALALIAFAMWLYIRDWGQVRRAAALAALAIVVWLAHLIGWALLGALVFAWEAAAAFKTHTRDAKGLRAGALQVFWRCLPLCVPLLVMAFVHTGGGGALYMYESPIAKLLTPLTSLSFANDRLDKYCAVLIVAMGAAAFLLRPTRIALGLAVAAAILFVAFLASPEILLGGGSVDDRLYLFLVLIFVTALAWRLDTMARWQAALVVAITLGAGAITVGRFTYTAIAVQGYNADVARNLALIDPLPKGARILVITVDVFHGGRPPLTFLPNMAVVRRDAFTNIMWEEPSGHPLRMKYLTEGAPLAGKEGMVVDFDPSGRSTGALLAKVESEPLDRFDYVWLVNSNLAAPLPAPRFVLSGATNRTAIYRIVHGENERR